MEASHGRSRRRDSYSFNELIDDDTSSRRYNPSPSPPSSTTINWGPPPAPPAAAEGPSSSTNSPAAVEKEHMFDKVVTPSDVGKLNRLVIPKQHAERYFPLDTATNEKGLLLSFEDRGGKPWRFRYSYWNSSQSYVMTKGWSRFVKEKRLDAGDTVSFGRAVEDKERLFIDWKRRPEMVLDHPRLPRIPMPMPPMVSFARSVGPGWAGRYVVPQAQNYLYNAGASGSGRQYVVFRSPVVPQPQAAEVQFGGGVGTAPMVLDSVPVVQSQTAAAAKRVRLFGVNLDFPDATDGDSTSVPSAAFSSSASPSPKGKEKELSLDLGM